MHIAAVARKVKRLTCFVAILFVYFFSTFVINIIQLLACLSFFLSKELRQEICISLSTRFWTLSQIIMQRFLRVECVFYGDDPHPTKRCITSANHSEGIDFLSTLQALRFLGIETGRISGLLKKSLLLMPGVGTINYFQGGIFVSRNWIKDRPLIANKVKNYVKKQKKPFALGIFPEGTRNTPEKYVLAQKFSKERGLPIFQKLLVPRPKGFILMVESAGEHVDCLCDLTFAYDPSPIYLTSLIFGDNLVKPKVHLFHKCHDIKNIPKREEALKKWLFKSFEEKDKLLIDFEKNKTFPNKILDHKLSFDLKELAFWAFLMSFFLYVTGVLKINSIVALVFVLIITLFECREIESRIK